MAKNFVLSFGSTAVSGLKPTFLVFNLVPSGGATTAPGITEVPTTSGLYYFSYEPPTVASGNSIAFFVDGATTGLAAVARYIPGMIDPIQAVDERLSEQGSTLVAIGNSNIAIGTSLNALIGSTASSFGATNTDPATVIGYLKRLQEFNEGNSIFTKSSGLWQIFARGNSVGASTQLTQKTITDSGSVITKG